jgi:hypothetical protein
MRVDFLDDGPKEWMVAHTASADGPHCEYMPVCAVRVILTYAEVVNAHGAGHAEAESLVEGALKLLEQACLVRIDQELESFGGEYAVSGPTKAEDLIGSAEMAITAVVFRVRGIRRLSRSREPFWKSFQRLRVGPWMSVG